MRSTGVARGGKLAEQLAYSGSIRYGKRGSRGIGGMALGVWLPYQSSTHHRWKPSAN